MPRVSRPVVAALLALAALAGCSRTGHPTFPPPARPPLFVQLDFETVFNQLRSMLEARSYPLVIEDERFGSVRTDWVYFGPGEVDVRPMADCPAVGTGGGRVRARFGFDVRRRTIQSTVTLLSHWQVERLAGFDRSDRGFVDCRSTGEWERMIEATLTQRRTIP
jgi:predicted small lipoprotein YifL